MRIRARNPGRTHSRRAKPTPPVHGITTVEYPLARAQARESELSNDKRRVHHPRAARVGIMLSASASPISQSEGTIDSARFSTLTMVEMDLRRIRGN